MKVPPAVLALKYAQAFTNVFAPTLHERDIETIERLHGFISAHREVLFLLKLPFIEQGMKRQAVESMVQLFHLPACIKNLVTMLVEHRRVELLAEVLRNVSVRYRQMYAKQSMCISSACQLSEHERELVEAFIKRLTAMAHSYTYIVRKDLVAGIRMQSNELFFEHSVRRRLRDIRAMLIR